MLSSSFGILDRAKQVLESAFIKSAPGGGDTASDSGLSGSDDERTVCNPPS
jgi:hypothetical protein